jgi:hypothetical protein
MAGPWEKYKKPEASKTFIEISPDASPEDRAALEAIQKETGGEIISKPWEKYKAASIEQEQTIGQRIGADIDAIPRQAGLAARYGIEGLSSVPDIVAAPVIAGVNRILPESAQQMTFGQIGQNVANRLGLPQPQNPTERIVGEASKMLAGGGGMVGAARGLAKGATGAGKALMEALAARPDLQAASAVGGGLAGGTAKEQGAGPAGQLGAALVGGLAAPAALSLGQGIASAIRGTVGKPIDVKMVSSSIDDALKDSGVRPETVSPEVISSLQQDVESAMKTGPVSGDALRRLVDYKLTGATPAKGNLTLTPADITQQKNLAKIGINSNNPALHVLANRQNENVGVMLNRLNELGGGTGIDKYRAGNKLISALEKPIAAKKAEISGAYELAKTTEGLSAKLDNYSFTQRAGDLLADNIAEGFLPPGIRSHLNSIAEGKTPLTVSTAEQLKTVMGKIQRNSQDGNTRTALGLVRQALDETPLIEGQGKEAIKAFNTARGMNREWMQQIEKTPALKAVLEGESPDRFVKDHIINAEVVDLARLRHTIRDNPTAIGMIKDQIITHLKRAAVGVNPDEARVFSQAGLNKAMDAIGDQKLRMILGAKEFQKLKSLGRVALYEQAQPVGSAVNNSNTAGAVVNYLDELAKKIPFGKQAISDPMEYLKNTMQAKGVTNIPNALAMKQAPQQQNRLGYIPAAALLAPTQQGD